jgi:glycosyltransferase involved in cell wall biosynthesis
MATGAGDRGAQAAAGCVVCRASDSGPDQTIAHVANRVAAAHPGADLALVLVQDEPPEGWLERLRACVAGESTSATASALPGPAPGAELADELSGARAQTLPGDAAFPRIAVPGGGCVYVARAAFDLLGGMDERMASSAGSVAELGLRAAGRGLANLLAGDVLVPAPTAVASDADRAELARRFPSLWPRAQEQPSEALEHAQLLARAQLRNPSVTIDARSLATQVGGTQVYALELVRALAESGEVDIRALVGPDPEAESLLRGVGVGSVITYEQALAQPSPTNLVHRPQQVFTIDDLELLRPLGHRLVISHLDLIAYHNPTYFPGLAEWRRHVRATRIAFDLADRLLFFSHHALADAEREDLVEGGRASVIPFGSEPAAETRAGGERPPALAERSEPFLLCIGADYAHKNRPFAMQLTAELRRSHGWPGILVLAGAHVPHGSSAHAERALLDADPELARACLDLGPVSAAERAWLLAHAAAVAYPTVLEGFGLVPFEAAAAGLPCLFAAQSSLVELLPASLATLDGWDASRASGRVIALLVEGGERSRHVTELQRACRAYDVRRCAELTLAAYRRTLASSARSSARRASEALEREREIVRLDRAVSDMEAEHRQLEAEHRQLLEDIGEDGMGLVGPHGLLSHADRRALLALAVRPALRRPLLALTRAGYGLAHRGGRDS